MRFVPFIGCNLAALALAAASSFAFAASPKVVTVSPDEQREVAAAAAAGSTSEPVKLTCKTMKVLGTRLGGKRVCKTNAEWQEDSARDRRMISEQQQMHSYGVRD